MSTSIETADAGKPDQRPRGHSWASVAWMCALVLATIAAIDFGIQQIAPVRHLREAADGVRDLADGNPVTLVLGSSHGRTFHALGLEAARRTGRNGELVAVPLENGKLTAYWWLMQHRLLPLLDERGPDGTLKRANLKKFVLLTEWWDSCSNPNDVSWNLPGRAWDLRAYVDDVLANGFTAYNRNYLQYHFVRTLDASALAHDRLQRRLPVLLKERLMTALGRPAPDWYADKLAIWQASVERGATCIGERSQMQALASILAATRDRGLDTRVVLFPRKPDTMTERARATTLPAFHAMVERVAGQYGARVVDLTLSTPLASDDFMDDFDHVDAEGNVKFARWALEHDFRDLLAPASSAQTAASSHTP